MRHPAAPTFADGFNPNQPRDWRGRWSQTGSLGHALGAAQKGQNDNVRGDLGPVDNATRIRDELGIDVEGYRLVLDSSDVRHVMKEHGDAAREAGRRPPQIPITPDDFARIPSIRSAASAIQHGVRSRGPSVLRYTATLQGVRYTYVETIRTSRRQLALKTLYKSAL